MSKSLLISICSPKNCGLATPLLGCDLHLAMCESRKHFKHKLKDVKLQEKEIFCKQLANDITKGDRMDVWRKIRSGMRPTKVNLPMRIGEETSEDGIMNVWKVHFGAIINSESQSSVDKERLLFEQKLQSRTGAMRLPWWVVKDVYPSEVVRSCRMLKLKKSAGADAIEAEHLKYGGFELAIHMSIAFSAFLRHSFIPSQWLESNCQR